MPSHVTVSLFRVSTLLALLFVPRALAQTHAEAAQRALDFLSAVHD